MGRFTNPRDLYFGEGARHEVKNLKGKKAIIERGASHIVVGRPITGADDPVAAFDAIVAELVENVA